MKKLKLDHDIARLVAEGELRTTWRLFDDKDLSVNDVVELIDKTNPSEPQTWQPIGTAVINRIIERRLGDAIQEGMIDTKGASSDHEALELSRDFYGKNVTLQTPAKIVFFDFRPYIINGNTESYSMPAANSLGVIKIYADGGSRGNPGPSASGYVILNDEGSVLVDKGVYLGVTTNNQAEYQALKFALEEALRMHASAVDVYMDSMLVVNQMKGIFKVKNRDLWPIHDAIKVLIGSFRHVSFTHVPRELNKLADAAVNRTLDEATSNTPKILS